MKILFKHNIPDFDQHIKYVLDFITNHPLTDGRITFTQNEKEGYDRVLSYGLQVRGTWTIPAQKLFFSVEKPSLPSLKSNEYNYQEKILYSVESNSKGPELFFKERHFSFDLIECIFFHITRYEEYHHDHSSGEFNIHNMFLPRMKLEKIPVVDHLIFAFCECLGLKMVNRASLFYLSHDIDKIYKYNNFWEGIKSSIWPIYYKLNPLWALSNFFRFLSVKVGLKKDPYDNYDYLFRSSESWEEKVVFFMAGGKTSYDLFDKYYKRDFDSIYKIAKSSEYQIGLHPSYDTADNVKMMQDEKEHLQQVGHKPIEYTRQHFLHYIHGKTETNIEANAFFVDSTLGFTRKIGFRCGTGFRYHLFDFEGSQAFSFYEQPLVVMDSSLIHECREDMDLFEKEIIEFILSNSVNTAITFNFHNSTFDDTLGHRKKLKKIYLKVEKLIESLI